MNYQKTFHNFINDQWQPSKYNQLAKSFNLRNVQEVIATFPLSNIDEVNLAVESPKNAYKTWRLIPAPQRGEYIYRTGDLLLQRKEEIAILMTR